ncbi:ATP-dependent DNA helicase RecG [bacterium]|nr:ATP-dependent DNA helicase RecG [bacterium]
MLNSTLDKVIRTTKAHINELSFMGINTLEDLLLNFPWRYSDDGEFVTVDCLNTFESLSCKGTLKNVIGTRTRTGKFMLTCKLVDETGEIDLMFFNQEYLKRILRNGVEVVVTGKIKEQGSRKKMLSPKWEVFNPNKPLVHSGGLIPVYNQSGKINSKWLREKIHPLLEFTNLLKDPLDSDIREKYKLMDFNEAVKNLHYPSSQEDLINARFRLGFEELLYINLKNLVSKQYQKLECSFTGKKMDMDLYDIEDFLKILPFKLTNAQLRAIAEVQEDLSKDRSMSRLLEGDVGAGKTLVAAASIFIAVKSGFQALIMAPTEILANQHYKGFVKLMTQFGMNIQVLTGSLTAKQKEQVKIGLKNGLIDIVVGTHAIIQDSVEFRNLGLAVIDEQHRFGVNQRAFLKKFGKPHVLAMTATPIPRTLALTIYGDQDLSILDEKPAGRKEIITRLVPESKRQESYYWIESQVKAGRQAFVICPLVEDSDIIESKSVVSEFDRLREVVFPNLKVGLVHGKMKQNEKDQVMLDFRDKKYDILVATTVIEVGIDIPNSSIIVIEDADRFGLAQLHQLRGRVGRGEHQSYCFLFVKSRSENTRTRMKAMCDHSDGFKLSEIDLELRGPGEVFGTRQSGIPDLKMASLSDTKLVKLTQEAAQEIFDMDPSLEKFPILIDRMHRSIKEFDL